MKVYNNLKKEIEVLREKIDSIDDQIIKYLNKRGELCQKIGKLKKLINLETLQPQREDEIINRMTAKSKILKNKSIKSIWKEIMEACKVIQEK